MSVRDAAEAEVAVGAGASLIDVKEPHRGALGAADVSTMREIVAAVDGRVPVSVALGELLDAEADSSSSDSSDHDAPLDVPEGVVLAKLGLAGCAKVGDWSKRWQTWLQSLPAKVKPVAVIYADWQTCAAPSPEAVIAAAKEANCAAVLIDTFDKSAGDLFAHWSQSRLSEVIAATADAAPWAVVAGSLSGDSISRAAACGPHFVAVRGAACRGGRTGTVDAECIRELVDSLSLPMAT